MITAQDRLAADLEDHGKPLSLSKHADEGNGTRMLELRLASHALPGAEPVHWVARSKWRRAATCARAERRLPSPRNGTGRTACA